MNHTQANVGQPSVDLLTVSSIAIVAYCLTNVLHEGVGHGAGCLLAGGQPEMLNAIFFQCGGQLSAAGMRVLAAGGSVVNLLVAAACLVPLRLRRATPGPFHYFLWLLLALNLLMPFGYLMFSGILGFGDWAIVIDGLRPVIVYRVLLAAVGAGLYFQVATRLLVPGLNIYLGADPVERKLRARQVALLPYLTGGVTFVVAGLLNPASVWLVLLSAAAASFGGTCWLAYYPGGSEDRRARHDGPPHGAAIPRRIAWVIVAGCVLTLFIGVLGRGIKL